MYSGERKQRVCKNIRCVATFQLDRLVNSRKSVLQILAGAHNVILDKIVDRLLLQLQGTPRDKYMSL